jgi:DNA-binding GntR family transcriptional regulator
LPEDTVERTSLTEQLYRILEERILSGTMRPGMKLSEEGLAEAFGVSRSPAREAIAELQRVGLAVRVGARDRIVSAPSETLISETFELWWILDSMRTYLSSLHATPADHQRLRDVLQDMERLAGEDDAPARVEASKAFHDLLYKYSGNSILDAIVSDYEKHIRRFKTLYFSYLDKSATSRIEHRHIVECYIRKDLNGLTQVIREHISRQRNAILRHFAEEGRTIDES